MADTDETMMTECWTEAETLAVLNGAMPETPENFLAYSENFFMHRFQDVRKNSEEMERILGNLEASAKVGNELAGAILGKAVLSTFSRRQVVEDALSYLNRAVKKGIRGAAAFLCRWYGERLIEYDLDEFEVADVGVDDCYSPTEECPRVKFPESDNECVKRIMELATVSVLDGQFSTVLPFVTFALSPDFNVDRRSLESLEKAMLAKSRTDADESFVHLSVLQLMKGDCKSKKTYVEIVENVAVRGVAVAEAYLGDFYLKGEYIKKDPARAVELLSRAAEKKSAFAMYKLGECYGSGNGVEKDGEKSASLVLGAAQLKFAPALVDVGRSLVEKAQGEERSKSIKLGCAMIREAAEAQGYPEAWQAILEFHEKGIGPFKTNKFARAARAALKELE